MRISTLASGRDNNFNLIRAVAASAVLVSHAFPLAGVAKEPLEDWAPANLGRLAVAVFFSISGFFIAKSFDRRSSLVEFTVDRVLRIYPALLVVLFLSAFVLGPALTTLPLGSYFSSKETWRYVPDSLTLIRIRWLLPGVFETNPSAAVNGSLWTLHLEVGCYAFVVLAGLLGGLRGKLRLGAAILFLAVYAAARIPSLASPPPLWAELAFPFAIGVAFYAFRDHIPLHWVIAGLLAIAAWVAHATPLYREVFVLALAYSAFCIGALRASFLLLYNRLGDYSYGIYILAFPIEQIVVLARPGIDPPALAVGAGVLTLAGAILSWHVLEGPVLDRRRTIGRALALRLNWPTRDAAVRREGI
jgi:peptidoglycan/LPS O-acetylase OafA/YrhL